MRRWIAPIAAVFALAAGAARAESDAFKDWAVVCDNTRVCSAFGFSPEGDDVTAFLRLDRDAEADAPVVLTLSVYVDAAAVYRLSVDGQPLPGLEAVKAPYEKGGYATAPFTPAQTASLLAAFRNGSALTLSEKGKPVATVSLAGSAAALRWLDDRQKRAGTVTALLATGPKPASAVPAPPAPPRLKVAPKASQAGLPAKLPEAVRRASSEDEETDKRMAALGFEPIVARLAPGVILWAPACSAGAYNIIYCFFLTDEKGGSLRPATFAGQTGEGSHMLMNADFDPESQTLSNFDKGRGLADCGAETEWVWDGKMFQLAEQTLMPECRGVMVGEWPLSFRSQR